MGKMTKINKVGFFSSVSLVVLTLTSFGFALRSVPPSGPYCPVDPMVYPFSNLLDFYPRDYIWMYVACFQLLAFLVFVASIHFSAKEEKQIYSFVATTFATIAVTVLLLDYFIQFSVVPLSMIKGETEGIALLTQYNGHGIFIAIEELGYTMMSLSFLALAPVFCKDHRLGRGGCWILICPFVATLGSFLFYSLRFGLDRSYRFEVVTITANWLVTIAIGVIVAICFFRKLWEKRLL